MLAVSLAADNHLVYKNGFFAKGTRWFFNQILMKQFILSLCLCLLVAGVSAQSDSTKKNNQLEFLFSKISRQNLHAFF